MRCSGPLLLAGLAVGQGPIGPSVLDLQRSYHAGGYAVTIAVPGGQIALESQRGTIDLSAGGALTGALDTWEWTAGGSTFTPGLPVAGTYHVGPDGLVEFDFDPGNPGTDTRRLWIEPDGATIHGGRADLDPRAPSTVLIAKSSGQTSAALNGQYWFFAHYVQLSAASMQSVTERGIVTFDGAGGAVLTGDAHVAFADGTTAAVAIQRTPSYSVATDGALVFGGESGAAVGGGELFFVTRGGAGSSEVGMAIGVRIGNGYDHGELTGPYGIHVHRVWLGPGPPYPITVVAQGVLALTATGSAAGTWQLLMDVVNGNATGTVIVPIDPGGPTTLAQNGALNLQFVGGGFEIGVSDSYRYVVGWVPEPRANLYFATRQCPPCSDFGTGTAGGGGVEPELGMRTFPTLGNAQWSFAITGGPAGAAAILPVAFARAAAGVPLAGGLLWLDASAIADVHYLALDAAGRRDVPLAIPADPAFAGFELYAQALMLDPAAPGGVSMSRGFAVTFCR